MKPSISLLGIYPREMKTDVHPKTCMQIFTRLWITGLSITVKTQEQGRYPSIKEQVNKLCYVHTTEQY